MKIRIQQIKQWGGECLIRLSKLCPIKRNKIFIMSYYGKGYDCNPKYLTEYVKAHQDTYNWDIVWAFNDVGAQEALTGVRKVRVMTPRYFYEMYTSRVILTNYRMTKQFHKRPSQYYIQTWHSSLRLKQIEKDAIETLGKDYIEMAMADSQQCDLLISGCAYSTHIFQHAFWYDGPILECGTPRNDYLKNPNRVHQEKIKEALGIDAMQKIVLYAPTFRKGHDLSVYDLEYDRLRVTLEKKWPGKWSILIRLHPHLNSDDLHIVWSENLRDASKWEDIQELLAVTDVLISDYSSLMFDFSFTKRPCFLYVPDLETYITNDRGLYFDVKALPFGIAEDKEALNTCILTFDAVAYEEALEYFDEKIGSFEQGDACKQLAEYITKIM
ncbi:CDP-glycerol glycerophosphotransferase family protein [Niameybacter massiliensis]|uniref:CDP-glycerol glycerophosphotransferase family protein n=1 Tax=Niameybacter massiliensis TaxID=1658108 RepID=UPI0006B5CBF8|nr:CDP-glycerol glycerophosphotransferase family protein [Niameybacter massiliensis]